MNEMFKFLNFEKDYFKEDFVRIGLFFPHRQFDTCLNGTIVNRKCNFFYNESLLNWQKGPQYTNIDHQLLMKTFICYAY